MAETPAVVAAAEAELRLLDPVVRSSAELIGELLHPDFTGVSVTGRQWDRDAIITTLTSEEVAAGPPITTSGMHGVEVAPDLVLLTFETEYRGSWAHRSSLWTRSGDGWLLYFHQGTVFTPEEPT